MNKTIADFDFTLEELITVTKKVDFHGKRACVVKPTGTVDLMIITAFGLMGNHR